MSPVTVTSYPWEFLYISSICYGCNASRGCTLLWNAGIVLCGTLVDVVRYTWYNICITLDACLRVLRLLRFGWLLGLRFYKYDYLQKFKRVSFGLRSFCGLWEGSAPANWFNHICWIDIVTPTNRLNSNHIHCAIKVFVAFYIVTLLFWNFC